MMITLTLPTKFNPPPPTTTTTTPSHHHPPFLCHPTSPSTLKHLLIKHVKSGKTHEAISTLNHFINQNHQKNHQNHQENHQENSQNHLENHQENHQENLQENLQNHPENHQENSQNHLQLYSQLLKSCIRTKRFNLGKQIHSKLQETNLEFDTLLLNTLITLYSKSGDLGIAEELFEGMSDLDRDVVSWSAMIGCYAREKGRELNAVLAFFDMVERDNGVYPNEYCFSGVIQGCVNGGYGWIGVVIFGFLIKSGYFESDVNIGCSLIDLFAKGLGDLESARKVFDRVPEKNSVCWTLMITRFAKLGELGSAVELFVDMVSEGFVPDRFTYSSVLSTCSELEELSLGQQVHGMVVKSGLSLDVCVGCSLVDMYAKCAVNGCMVESRRVFDQIPNHNVMSWTAIVTGYARSDADYLEAIDLYCGMLEDGVKPNHITFSSLLKACANLRTSNVGEQVHSHTIKFGVSAINCVGNSLITMYAKSGGVEEARKCFDVLFQKNLVSYNASVDGYIKNVNTDEAFEIFNQIKDSGVAVDAFTFSSLLSGAASIGAVSQGEQIHGRLLKEGFRSDQPICNSLISMYSRCGNLDSAFQVFDEMVFKNVISWTAIITGFAKHGYAQKALDLFHQMLENGVKPNEVTYVAVLSACSHVGLVDRGWEYFSSMSKEHGINPRIEHYACMVDIYGRAGNLENALQFIKAMPFPANALVWRTLLSACRVHGNAELGKYAAEMILEQDQNDPAAHVLLSNLYASKGQWEKVADIRKSMKERDVIKEAGCSWIEADKKVHKFYVADTKHPRAKEIYEELHQLGSKIKDLGYVPNTDLVLHEVEEEQKEQYLFQHSEKIAVAFGLISTSKTKPIRIFKNLRVCADCHNAIKYISLATGREIIVRDSNRFHHIKNGFCSCNDYW